MKALKSSSIDRRLPSMEDILKKKENFKNFSKKEEDDL